MSDKQHCYLVSWKAASGAFGHADIRLDAPWGWDSCNEVVDIIVGMYPHLQGEAVVIQFVMPIASEVSLQTTTVYPWLVSISFFDKELRQFVPFSLLTHRYDDGLITKEDIDEGLSEFLKDQIGDNLWQVTFFGRMASYTMKTERDTTAPASEQHKSAQDITICRSDERDMEMSEITAGAIEFIGTLDNGFCHKHPDTPRLKHPFMQTASYPPQSVMYCPECEPGVAEWDKQLRNGKGNQ